MKLNATVDDFGDEFVRRVRFSSFEDYEALANGDSVVITKQESTQSSVEPDFDKLAQSILDRMDTVGTEYWGPREGPLWDTFCARDRALLADALRGL